MSFGITAHVRLNIKIQSYQNMDFHYKDICMTGIPPVPRRTVFVLTLGVCVLNCVSRFQYQLTSMVVIYCPYFFFFSLFVVSWYHVMFRGILWTSWFRINNVPIKTRTRWTLYDYPLSYALFTISSTQTILRVQTFRTCWQNYKMNQCLNTFWETLFYLAFTTLSTMSS